MTLQPDRLMTVLCTIVARVPDGTDAYGGDKVTEVESEARCWYGSPATEERGGQVFQTLIGYFGPDTVLDYVTAVDIDGLGRFEVDGTPIAHRSPRTGVATHKTVKLRRGA